MSLCFAVINNTENITENIIFSIEFSISYLFSNNFLPRNGKIQANYFSVTAQINTFLMFRFFDSKHVWIKEIALLFMDAHRIEFSIEGKEFIKSRLKDSTFSTFRWDKYNNATNLKADSRVG